MATSNAQLAFQIKTLFKGSYGTIPEPYARHVERKNLQAWITAGFIVHHSLEKLNALRLKGEARFQ